MDNFICECKKKKKKIKPYYANQKCCCEEYQNLRVKGSSQTNKAWQIILNNTNISQKCEEVNIELIKCSCSFAFCSCCQESRRKYSLYKLEEYFHNSFQDNTANFLFEDKNKSFQEKTANFLINSLIAGIEDKNKAIQALNSELLEAQTNYAKSLSDIQMELGKQQQIIEDLKGNKLVSEQEINDIIANIKKNDLLLQEAKMEKTKLQENLKEKDHRIEKLLNKDVVKYTEKRDYDFIIHIDSLYDLMKEGWKLTYNVNDSFTKEKIQDSLNSNKILVGVIGYENVGKTHILNKFCGKVLPIGYNYHTQGLSFKISENEKLPFIYADAAGCGKPFSYYHNNDFTDKDKNQEEKSDIVNDRIMTETFIQDFILANCNIILIILGQLTQEYQKMIERIIRNYYSKKIFIIHNFSNLSDIQSVEEKIKRDIVEAFPVKEQKLIAFDEKTDEQSKKNEKQYIEERKGSSISHLVYAREETDAGNFYNEMTINAMKMFLRTDLKYKKFNLVESFNSFCCKEKLRSYLSLSLDNIEIKDLKMQEVDDRLRLNKKISFKIKQGVFNAFGTLIIDNIREDEFDPPYKVYENESKFTIFISMPGRMKGSTDKITMKAVKEENTKGIQIEGNIGDLFKIVKEEEFLRKEGIITGNFNKKILFCDSDKDFNFDNRKVELQEGVYMIELPKISIESKPTELP